MQAWRDLKAHPAEAPPPRVWTVRAKQHARRAASATCAHPSPVKQAVAGQDDSPAGQAALHVLEEAHVSLLPMWGRGEGRMT